MTRFLQKFILLEKTDPYEVDELFAVFRFHHLIPEEYAVMVDDEIADPRVDSFFAVLGEIGTNEWIAYLDGPRVDQEYRGYYLVRWNRSPIDSGYFYCPYVPLMQTPTVMTAGQSILTKYGKKLLKQGAKYYGKISISGPKNGKP